MAYENIGTAPLKRLKRTLELNNIKVAECQFFRSADCIRYYALGGGYMLATGTTALGTAVHSIQPYENAVLRALVEIKNVC
jgi:hypothetical protein